VNARQGLTVACLAGFVFLAWVGLAERRPLRVAASPRAAVVESEAPAVLELDAAAPDEARRAPSAPEVSARPALGAGSESVLVRVQLVLASQEPRSLAGWRVELQSWLASTHATFLHEARANAAGVAEFRFPERVHVDWIRCRPPMESGLALAFSELHGDLEPGATLAEILEFEAGAGLVGYVADLEGLPVEGARVDAFSEGTWLDVEDWQPGLERVTTDSAGRYEFQPLPPGEWCVAVEPRDWLQLEAEESCRELEAGPTAEGPELRVAPLHLLRVRVLDTAGAPVPDVELELTPLELGARILARDPDPLEIFLGSKPAPEAIDAPLVWPYREIEGETDERGEAELHGVAGTWELVAVPSLHEADAPTTIQMRLQLPCSDLVLRIPSALGSLNGRVVDEDGRGIEGVVVVLSGEGDHLVSTTAQDGFFAMHGVPPGVDLEVELHHDDYVPSRVRIATANACELLTFELRRAGRLRLALRDSTGAPVVGRTLSILSVRPVRPLLAGEVAWAQERQLPSSQTDSVGRIEFERLPAGDVELGLLLPFLRSNPQGHLQIFFDVFQRWSLPMQADEHVLDVDLTRYLPPRPIEPPMVAGVVIAATTGLPVVGASVGFRRTGTWTNTGALGEFGLALTGGRQSLAVVHPGYQPVELPAPQRGERLRIVLQPGLEGLELDFVDREGARLPRVAVRVRADLGDALIHVRSGARAGLVEGWWIQTHGSIELDAVPYGLLFLELGIDGHELGEHVLEVPLGTGVQRATIRLERSLEEMRRAIEAEVAGKMSVEEDE
jgi:hypothetical protein